MDDDVYLVSSEVINLLDLYLSALLCLKDGLDDHRSGLAVRNLCNGESVLVYLLDLCTDLYLSALALAAVLRTVCSASGKEIREYLEILSLKDCYGCIDEFIEVMRENL